MKELITRLRDDFDRSLDGVETIEFGYRGIAYEIELSPANAAIFDEQIGRYIAAGRKVKQRSRKRKAKATTNGEVVDKPVRGAPPIDGKELRDRIREFARQQGIPQSNIGQLKRESVDAYYAAHPEEVTT